MHTAMIITTCKADYSQTCPHLSNRCRAMIYVKVPIAEVATSTVVSNWLSKELGGVIAQE